MRKTYYTVRHNRGGRIITMCFRSKEAAEAYFRTHDYSDNPEHHTVSRPDTIQRYEEMAAGTAWLEGPREPYSVIFARGGSRTDSRIKVNFMQAVIYSPLNGEPVQLYAEQETTEDMERIGALLDSDLDVLDNPPNDRGGGGLEVEDLLQYSRPELRAMYGAEERKFNADSREWLKQDILKQAEKYELTEADFIFPDSLQEF